MLAEQAGRLCVFVRAPVQGQVKKRLAASIGETAALAAYRTLVERTLAAVCGTDDTLIQLWVAGEMKHPEVEAWARHYHLSVVAQSGPDLGDRMRTALAAAQTPHEPRVLIGSDCVGIDEDYVNQAFEALGSHDLVIGPAEDGGYGLIGCRADLPDLFTDIPWGESRVCRLTLTRARTLGLSTAVLNEIWDVDTAPDWARYLAALA